MTYRRRAAAAIAVIVASGALALGVSAPAASSNSGSAVASSNSHGYYADQSGSINCPTNMVGKLTYKKAWGSGYVSFGGKQSSWHTASTNNVIRYAYSGKTGPATYQFWDFSATGNPGYVYDVHVTCIL